MPLDTSAPIPNSLHCSQDSQARVGASLLTGNQEVAQEQFGDAIPEGEFAAGIKLFSGTIVRETEGESFRVVLQLRDSLATRLRDDLQ